MNKIEVKHSSIVIHDYNMGDSTRIESFFSIFNKLTHKYDLKVLMYDAEKKDLYLPRGIDIFFVENAIGTKAHINVHCDPIGMVTPIRLTSLPRDLVQEEGVRFLLGQAEYSYTKSKSQLSVNLNPGEGKTYLSVAICAFLCMRTIMITATIGWIEQWKAKIMEYTDIKSSEIYIASGMGSIAKLLNGMVDINTIKFVLAPHRTIRNYGEKYGWDKVGELFALLKIGIKIYDEAHLEFDNIARIDLNTNTYKTIYLTATPAQSDEERNVIYQAYFKNIPALDLFDDERDPRTHYVAIHYNSHPTAADIQHCRNRFGFDMLRYVDYIITKPNFYKLIFVLSEIIKKKGKTLIYIGKNYAIEQIYHWMEYWIPEFRGNIGIYNSTVPKELKPLQLSKMVILSTTKSCGAAIDIKGLKLAIVLAEPFGSEVIARQTLGRTRDKDTMYIEIVDKGFSTLKGYYKHKQALFSKYAKSYTDITLTDEELLARCNDIAISRQNYYNALAQHQDNLITVVERVSI